MRNNQQKEIYEKTSFKLKKNLGVKNEDKNQINTEKNSNINNIPTDLSSPAPSFMYQKNPNLINKNKFYHMLEVSFDKELFRLFFYINHEDMLNIELIPKDGTLPFSYKNVFDKEKFYEMNKIFMELKTVEKIAEKIIKLFKKEKVLLGKNKKEDIFYLILKITVIDEDIDIFIPLKKNEDIQLCTIIYLLKEADKLKNEFTIYKNEIEEIRIEGFTAPDKTDPYGEGSEHDYTSGIELSQERTMNVLLYCLEHTNYSQENDPKKKEAEKEWIRKHIVSNGYSLSRPLGSDGKLIDENRKLSDGEKAASRRVEFRIKTNSDKIVQQFQNKSEKN